MAYVYHCCVFANNANPLQFPTYLEKPPAPLSAEDRTRYENQFACVKKVITIFEASTYDDANAECSKHVVDLMGEVSSSCLNCI